jgi:putative copper export protein
MLDSNDIFLLIIRWIHNIASVIWVGGCLFYLLTLNPVAQASNFSKITISAIGKDFGSVVNGSIALLILTGTILTFERISSPTIINSYISILFIKIILAFVMFWLALSLKKKKINQPSRPKSRIATKLESILSETSIIAILGIIIFLIADLLKIIFEKSLVQL